MLLKHWSNFDHEKVLVCEPAFSWSCSPKSPADINKLANKISNQKKLAVFLDNVPPEIFIEYLCLVVDDNTQKILQHGLSLENLVGHGVITGINIMDVFISSRPWRCLHVYQVFSSSLLLVTIQGSVPRRKKVGKGSVRCWTSLRNPWPPVQQFSNFPCIFSWNKSLIYAQYTSLLSSYTFSIIMVISLTVLN